MAIIQKQVVLLEPVLVAIVERRPLVKEDDPNFILRIFVVVVVDR